MTKASIRVAVATKEGRAVSEHFGHAKSFQVFDVSAAGCRLLAHREVRHYCLGNRGDKSALADILETVADCQAVFVAKIGDGPAEKLAARGIAAVADYAWEEIEPALQDYFRR